MKKALLLLFFVSTLFSLQGQKNVILHFVQKAGAEDFALNASFTTGQGHQYKAERLEYYVSLPSVTHDGGQVTETPTKYFLVDAAEEAWLELGEMDVENIEGVTFSIGVDEARNHLDPALYPPTHPLALQNPSMHWGWVGGYRFIAMEGKSGNNFAYFFEIHSIGNELYRTVNLQTEAEADGDNLIIHLRADYNKLLDNIDISGGVYAHGNLGAAAAIMDNIGSIVFSPYSTTSVNSRSFDGYFHISPNPATGGAGQADFYLPLGDEYQLAVTDLAGRLVSLRTLPTGYASESLSAPGAGMYLVQLRQNGVPVATKKWVVAE